MLNIGTPEAACRLRSSSAMAVALGLTLAIVAWAADNRTTLEPGWNMFSPQQDVEMGQQLSADAEHELPMLNNSRVDNYVNSLGQRLSAEAPGEDYPYVFEVVNDGRSMRLRFPAGRSTSTAE
jgi:predicted Zn-dependent protease